LPTAEKDRLIEEETTMQIQTLLSINLFIPDIEKENEKQTTKNKTKPKQNKTKERVNSICWKHLICP
jgi:hypothetical protein